MNPSLPAATEQRVTATRLPNNSLDEVWQTLFFPTGIPERALSYLDVLARLGQMNVSAVKLALRRAVLFSGPPGTGKTSLAQSLPNAWARRHSRDALLVSFDTHNIPSAERGGTQRNVQSAFSRVAEVASAGLPVFVHIDEVETLATDRASVNPATNPLDTLYGVNAFIESLDACVRDHPNVVFLFTSNLPRFIDRAIGERVDFEEHIPLPDSTLRRRILADALAALHDETPAAPAPLPVLITASAAGAAPQSQPGNVPGNGLVAHLSEPDTWEDLIRLTDGFSARELRHLVVLALVLAGDPTKLDTTNLLDAAQHQLELRRHHEETGGTYGYTYQR